MTNKEQLLALTQELNGYGCNYTKKDWMERCSKKWLDSQIDQKDYMVRNSRTGEEIFCKGSVSQWLVEQIKNIKIVNAGVKNAKAVRLVFMFRYMLMIYDHDTYMRIID